MRFGTDPYSLPDRHLNLLHARPSSIDSRTDSLVWTLGFWPPLLVSSPVNAPAFCSWLWVSLVPVCLWLCGFDPVFGDREPYLSPYTSCVIPILLPCGLYDKDNLKLLPGSVLLLGPTTYTPVKARHLTILLVLLLQTGWEHSFLYNCMSAGSFHMSTYSKDA